MHTKTWLAALYISGLIVATIYAIYLLAHQRWWAIGALAVLYAVVFAAAKLTRRASKYIHHVRT
jgi:4-hydroxybenzoate polyprenyltransferase